MIQSDYTDREPHLTDLQICENMISSARFDWTHKQINEDELKLRITKICERLQRIKNPVL